MTSSAAGAPRDGDDDDLGDLPEGLLPEGVLDDAAEDDAPARSKPTPSPRKPPPSSSPSRLDARGEDDKSALDATVPKVSPVPDLSFTSFTSAPTRYDDRETRAEVASRAATRLPAAVRPVTGFDHARVAPAGWFSHPRAENGSLTYCPISPRPRPRSQANMWSSSPPGGAKSPGATAPRIPAPRDPVRRRPRPRRPRPVFFFPKPSFHLSRSPNTRDIDRWEESSPMARRGDARRDRRRRTKPPVTPDASSSRTVPSSATVGYAFGAVEPARAPRHRAGGCPTVPWVPSLSQTRRRAPTVPPTGTSVTEKNSTAVAAAALTKPLLPFVLTRSEAPSATRSPSSSRTTATSSIHRSTRRW